ncbi:MAG TPA: glycosyltransferase family 4 protein [Candidatus Saccharimonadia bacterium]
MKTILHVGPAKHGIAAYDLQIDQIYRQQGFAVEPVLVDDDTAVREVVRQLAGRLAAQPEAVCHFEIGSGDQPILAMSRALLAQTGRPQLVTIHDPGVVVKHPLAVPGTLHTQRAVALPAKAVRNTLSATVGKRLLASYLADRRIVRSYLRPDLAESQSGTYIPQPTYHPELPAVPAGHSGSLRIGFGGYWGLGKGLETLLDAAEEVLSDDPRPDMRLVVGGGTSGPHNAYAEGLRQRARQVDPQAELPGFVDDDALDSWLQSLDVLVLPYWPELPNGTSAMAMRAAELAVPIIASNTKALSGQLGPDGASYVTPKDTPALVAALRAFIADPEAARRRAVATQQHIFAGHNWAVVGRALSAYVQKLEQTT